MVEFTEKSGETPEDAIVILNTKDSIEGVNAEYEYLGRKYGMRGKDWNLKLQSLVQNEGKFYDRMDLIFSDGSEKTIYFEITEFFGKGFGL
jgi:hypothetical protein